MLFCTIPKVGCTNWKKMFMYLSGSLTAEHNKMIKDDPEKGKDLQTIYQLYRFIDQVTHRAAQDVGDQSQVQFLDNFKEMLVPDCRNQPKRPDGTRGR